MAAIIVRPIILLFLICLSVGAADQAPSPYEALRQYNFPVGLLPKGATGYRLNRETGAFSAYLNGSCSFALGSEYRLRYKPEISGVISEGRLRELSGVSVKVLVWWMNIVEVRRKGEAELELSVGIASASFPVENFEECPQCGCGLECGSGNHRQASLLSSF